MDELLVDGLVEDAWEWLITWRYIFGENTVMIDLALVSILFRRGNGLLVK